MANTINWGQGAVNNTNGWGKSATNNTIDFGEVCADSWSPETNLVGGTSFSNTQSIELDGVDDYVDFDKTIAGTTFSISGWFKVANTTDLQPIISTRENQVSSSRGIDVFVKSNILEFRVYYLGTTSVTTAFTDTGWNHFMYVYNSTTLKAYLNGSSIGTAVGSYGVGTQTLKSGKFVPNNVLGEMNIDEVALWSSDESSNIGSIYSASGAVDLSSLSPLNWWRFEGTGTTATDSGSEGSNGTLINGATRTTDVPT